MNTQNARKPFVIPQLKEEASLASITLISGGGHVRRGYCKKGKNNRFSNKKSYGHYGRNH